MCFVSGLWEGLAIPWSVYMFNYLLGEVLLSLDVLGSALSSIKYVQKFVIYFTTVTLVVSSDIWTLLLELTTDIFLAHEIKRKSGYLVKTYTTKFK